jgi:hypothetical protein
MAHLVRLHHSHINPKLAKTGAQRRIPRHLLLLQTAKVRDVNALLEDVLLHFSSGRPFAQRGKIARRRQDLDDEQLTPRLSTRPKGPRKLLVKLLSKRQVVDDRGP